jgi:3'(2'), 5'-bisphosphate nucleotidase
MPVPEMDDHVAARDLAEAAGAALRSLRGELAERDAPAAEAKDQGDQVSQDLLMRLLGEQFPDDAVLSEEGADDLARLTADRVWIIDPLDGTREFSEYQRDDWAVHVALWESGELVAGAVALPARGITYATGSVPRLCDPDVPIATPIRLAVSRSRPPAFVNTLADHLRADLVPMGSAGVKAMSVVTGLADAYVHAGGQYEWDSAAPVAVARAAGLHTSRIDGSPLTYNNADPWLPDLLVCPPARAQALLTAITDVGGSA